MSELFQVANVLMNNTKNIVVVYKNSLAQCVYKNKK